MSNPSRACDWRQKKLALSKRCGEMGGGCVLLLAPMFYLVVFGRLVKKLANEETAALPKRAGLGSAHPGARSTDFEPLCDVQRDSWTFVEVCKASGLSKSTAFRFLKKLAGSSLPRLRRTEAHLPSRIESAARSLFGFLAFERSRESLAPFLERLAAEAGEAVNFALATDQGPMIVDAVFAPNAFQPHLLVGVTLRSLAIAHTRVFAAYAKTSTNGCPQFWLLRRSGPSTRSPIRKRWLRSWRR